MLTRWYEPSFTCLPPCLPPRHLWINPPSALTPPRSWREFNGATGSLYMCVCLSPRPFESPRACIISRSPAVAFKCVYMCVVCAGESESDLVAVVINGGNFQCWFHSDNSSQAKERRGVKKKKKAILLVALFCTIDPKKWKYGKLSISEAVFSITTHTHRHTIPSSHSQNTPNVSSPVLKRLNQPCADVYSQAATFISRVDWSGCSASGISTVFSLSN